MNKIVEMTHAEKVKMYMKCTKKDLIEMLIECNKHLNNKKPIVNNGKYINFLIKSEEDETQMMIDACKNISKSKPLGDFESRVLEKTLKRTLKTKPTLPGRK